MLFSNYLTLLILIYPLWLFPTDIFAQETIDSIDVNFTKISLPLQNLKVNSGFGHRTHPVTGRSDFHTGVDLAARSQPVYCIMDGLIAETGYNPILGIYVRIWHRDFISIYGHLSQVLIEQGARVHSGTILGITGTTGRTTGEHLHFSIKFRGAYLNPLLFIHELILSGGKSNN